ncbi:hypothetical protein DW886_21470 [Enterocloster aldenensis]|uniref:IstB-like ATP-binding domain-containing protein n=1 Tax=Enterocloster aldenensis TaxID=358742 RepID=UPI000E51E6C9|nr:hypothetical protein DW886_21470 [Enterocloster aldenensis]
MKDDTLKKLKAMRLPAFAEAYQMQNDREPEYQSMSFHERLMLLVDAEYDSRHNNNIKRKRQVLGWLALCYQMLHNSR